MAPRVAAGSAYDGRFNGATYLLPPLVGLPLPDMRANGFGARNAGNTTYYRLIVVHAVFACLAFMLFIPAAVVCTRYLIRGRNPRTAMYGHIGSNSAAIICLTVTFAAGYSAVGRGNWGSNPHHIIGATIYVGVLFQALFGVFVRWRNSTKIQDRQRPRIVALHTMLHQWLGRSILFLGLAQIPLGLYLYGSPLVLFILYTIFMALFILAWFVLDYLNAHKTFHDGRHSPSGDRPLREMSETGGMQSGATPHVSEIGEVSRFEEPAVQTPRRGRFSLFSNVFKKRESGMNRESEQMVIDDRGTSFDTSRAPSTSLVAGGLGAPPNRQPIPPVPHVPPAHLVNPNNQANLHRDNNDQYAPPQREEYGRGYRDSTTLGHGAHLPPPQPQQQISMPDSPYSQTTSGINSSEPVSEVSALSSGARRFPYVPVNNQYERLGNEYEEMPTSPLNQSDVSAPSSGGRRFPGLNTQQQYTPLGREYEEMPPSPMGYMEVDEGFARPLQGGAVEPPMVPLPMPPEPPRRPSHSRGNSRGNGSRGRNSEDVVRLPISHSNEFLTLDRREATPGFETIRLSKGNPNVSVQVRVNPDGKSVTVRRIPTEEAERDRRERARQRAERAQQRERSMDLERQNRRSGSQGRGRRSSSIERPDTQYGSSVLGADSNISSAIAGHSGGLLGGSSVVPSPPSRNLQTHHHQQGIPEPPRAVVQTPMNQGVPLPVPAPWTNLGNSISPSQRASVVSATGTEANSELEQEMAKDYRRKKRREERSGVPPTSQVASGPGSTLMSSSLSYGDDAEDGGVQWT